MDLEVNTTTDDEYVKELYDYSFLEMIKKIPSRLVTLLYKLMGIKGACLALATWLQINGSIESWAWVLVVLIVIFGREALKFIAEIRG